MESAITSGVVNAFSSGGRVKVVPIDQADAILQGEVVAYSLEGLAFNHNANVQAYRLRLVLNVEFRDVEDDRRQDQAERASRPATTPSHGLRC